MKAFMKKHPALAERCDAVLSVLSGSFALLAIGLVLRLLHRTLASWIAFGFAGAIFLMRMILLIVEAHQARVLNELAARENRK